MAFRDFTVEDIHEKLKLQTREVRLFAEVPSVTVRKEFAETLEDGVDLATAIDTEKAKSEFIIAPILLELRRTVGDKFKLFSGVEWNVEPGRGLNGYCDFILTRGSTRLFITAPFLAIAEAKNDHIINGLGQCIAAMYAATVANQKANHPLSPIYGIVTTGVIWQFLRLVGDVVEIAPENINVSELPQLMGMLTAIVR
jgi:hypothetical protein